MREQSVVVGMDGSPGAQAALEYALVRSVLLGSVGLYCVLHAECPVTIVPPRAAEVTA